MNSSTYRDHITLVDSRSKEDRAKELYGITTYDTALPEQWVQDVCDCLNLPRGIVLSSFVWLYPNGSFVGEPAPLNLEACDILSAIQDI